ncbi:MAG TPA: hypothetical protein VK633_12625, partial [Verrucomicrobiae bacterium]|nr:hypothetical protein [Verrucomicrobiae bacterium]
MSLLNAFLRDALLQTVMQQDVYLAVRTDAPAGGGAGTWDDPYYAASPSLSESANADLFDAVMNSSTKVPVGATVRMGPGTFFTKGNANNGTGAWAAKNGRLLGSGMGVTTLKLVSVLSGQARSAIGMNHTNTATPLDGFEVSNFTVDCGFLSAVSNTANRAIAVYGKHIFLHRIRAINFGGNIEDAVYPVMSAAADGSENCIIQECVVESPAATAATQSVLYFFSFGGATTSPHRFCVIRDCAGRGSATFEPAPTVSPKHYGVAPGCGVGTIIEGNQFANIAVGISNLGMAELGRDLVVWSNYFRNVWKGVFLRGSGSAELGRVITSDNIVEVGIVLTMADPELGSPTGIYFDGSGSG